MSNLADVRVKPVKITLDKERSLLFDLNAFAAVEEVYESVDKAFEDLEKGKIKALRTLLWAGLLHEDENLTLKDVGRIVTLADMDKIAPAINEALQAALPKEAKNVENPPEKK